MSPTTPDAVVRFKIDPGPFIRSTHDVAEAFRGMSHALRTGSRPPRRPYPKRYSLMTAREYRAARRAYARALRAHRKATR